MRRRIVIETDGAIFLAEFHRQRQADVAETDDADDLSAQASHCNSVPNRGV